MTLRSALLVLLLLPACSSGVDELQRCIDHAVEEGVSLERAQEGCDAAVGDR